MTEFDAEERGTAGPYVLLHAGCAEAVDCLFPGMVEGVIAEAATLPKVPTLIVLADRKPDHRIARGHAELAQKLGEQVIVFPGATHDLHLDRPDEPLEAVRSFLRGAIA